MARQKGARSKKQQAQRHPLLVYYNLGKRYRSPGVLLILLGLASLLPMVIEDLQQEQIAPEALAGVGVGLIAVGLALLVFARLNMRRAYVEVKPSVVLVKTPFYSVQISYRRIKRYHSVQVAQLFPRESLSGMGKPLVTPLLPMTAVEMLVSSWPKPPATLKRYMSDYLFSSGDGWVFIVPNYSILTRQLDTAMQNWRDARQGRQSSGYEDPIARMTRRQ